MTESMKTSLAIIPRTVDECTDLAERFSKSTLLPKSMQGKMPDVLVTIMAGQEMGLAPMASLRAFHVIEGKPVLAADGMVAVVLGSGKCVYFERIEESDTAVTYETLRVGAKTPRRCTWTMAMAKAAGLSLKDNWRCYPRAMLASRAKAELARDVYPDVLAGCYTPEEHDGYSPEAPRPTYVKPSSNDDAADAEIVTPEADEPGKAEIAAIDAAETIDQLKAPELLKGLDALKGPAKKIAKERYGAKLKALKEREVAPAAPTAENAA